MLFLPTVSGPADGSGFYAKNLVTGTPSTTVWSADTITSGAGVDTLGAWNEIFTATAVGFDIHLLEIWIAGNNTSAADSSTLMDIGIGGAGSEVVLIPQISAGWSAAATVGPRSFVTPVFIPMGTRISMRSQAITASRATQVAVFAYGYFGRSGSRLDIPRKFQAIGTTTTGSRGTSHTPGNTGAYSAWANIGSVAAFEGHFLHLMSHGQGTKTDTTMLNVAYHVQIGFSSGTIIYGEWWVGTSTNETLIVAPTTPIPCGIGVGTQLQIRAKCSGTAEAQDFSVLMGGV